MRPLGGERLGPSRIPPRDRRTESPATGTAGGREPSAAGPLRHGQGPVPSPEWPTFNDEEPRGYKDLALPSRVRTGLRGRPSLTAFGVWAKACMDAMPQPSLSGCCPCPAPCSALPGCRREPRYRPPRHCFGDPACPPNPGASPSAPHPQFPVPVAQCHFLREAPWDFPPAVRVWPSLAAADPDVLPTGLTSAAAHAWITAFIW